MVRLVLGGAELEPSGVFSWMDTGGALLQRASKAGSMAPVRLQSRLCELVGATSINRSNTCHALLQPAVCCNSSICGLLAHQNWVLLSMRHMLRLPDTVSSD